MSVGIIRNVYESFARGDLPGALKDFHPQIDWREPRISRMPTRSSATR